jgi:hypothetical protein
MPCYDPTGRTTEHEECEQRVHYLTRLLCSLANASEKMEVQFPDSVKVWWMRHKKQDAFRKRGHLLREEISVDFTEDGRCRVRCDFLDAERTSETLTKSQRDSKSFMSHIIGDLKREIDNAYRDYKE